VEVTTPRRRPGVGVNNVKLRGIEASDLGYRHGVQEAMKRFTNLPTFSLPT
jgi:hypothetical protein